MSDGNSGESDGESAELSELEPKRGPVSLRTRSFVLGGVVLLATVAGVYTYRQVKPVVESRKYASVTYEVPKAPKLTPASGETVYRIDPTKSSLSYRVQEHFAGQKTSTATGISNGIAGEVAVDPADLGATRVGPIVASIEQLHSDNNLRDARLRQDYLQSNKYPLATFKTTAITGLDGKLTEGKAYPVTLTGTLKLKDTTKKAAFTGTATLADGKLTAKVTTKAKLSDFDAGPIRIAGMVTTSNDAAITLKVTAYDPSAHTIPTTITGPHAKEAKDAPSYAKTVQPILEANCASCHNTGQMGAHVLTLDTAGDAQAVSDGLKTVTQLKHMPPWPASDKGVPLAHKMSLTQAEIDAIAKWADAGGVLDVDGNTAITPVKPPAGTVPRKDVVLDRPPYTGSLKNTNDYRCFVLDPKLTKATYMTGYTFLADQVEELHHAQVFHITAAQKKDAATKDGQGGQPGWPCYGGPGLSSGRPSFHLPPALQGKSRTEIRAYFKAHPDEIPKEFRHRSGGGGGGSVNLQPGLIAGWVPGQTPVRFPEDSGIVMQAGDALVLQVHYHFSDPPTPDRSTMALQLDPLTTHRKKLEVINPIGPVEIPCAPKDQKAPLCDRDAAMAENVRLYGPTGASNETGLLGVCKHTSAELAATFDGNVATSSCVNTVPEDGTIVGVLGHMHTLGKTFRMTLDPGTSKQKILLDIPDWSFDWQMNYGLAKPLHVMAGDPLLMEGSWDRRADPLRAPKYIVFAEGTEDEMCFGTYGFIPDKQS